MVNPSISIQDSSDTRRCHHCGGLNPPAAQWCGLCLQRFEPDEVEPGAARRPAADPDAGAASTARGAGEVPASDVEKAPVGLTRGAFEVTPDGIMWSCARCEGANPIEVQICSVCGAAFAETLRPPETALPERDPNNVALYSLFFPGAGHAYMGMWGQAIARGVMSLWVIAVVILTGVQNGPFTTMPVIFGVIAFALWIVAAHDAYREASRQAAMVLLKNRYFLYLVLGILMLMMGLLVVQGLAAGGAGAGSGAIDPTL